MRNALRDAKIGYTGLNAEGDAIVFTIREPDRIEDARQALAKIDPDSTVEIAADGDGHDALQHSGDRSARAARRSTSRSRSSAAASTRPAPRSRRSSAKGRTASSSSCPGVDNPEHVKALLGRTAKLTFQLVDTERLAGGCAARPTAAGRRDPAGSRRAGRAQRRRRLRRAQARDGRRRHAGRRAGDLPEQRAGRQLPLRFAGAQRFGDATRENVGKPFAIVLDNKVISAPVIREPILGGCGIISGSFTVQTANDLALLLRAGALPAPITILEERTVGPDLGADSIHAGAIASIVGVVLVVVFMILFYGLFGIFADIALFFNLCLMLGGAVVARRDADLARHRRHRAHHGHGGRRQRADL